MLTSPGDCGSVEGAVPCCATVLPIFSRQKQRRVWEVKQMKSKRAMATTAAETMDKMMCETDLAKGCAASLLCS